MKRSLLLLLLGPLPIYASQNIPIQAWSRDINAGGYTDGAPIGGFGAGTISWRFNGNFYLNRLNIGTGNDSGSAFTNDANARFHLFTRPVAGTATTRRLDAATLGSGQATYYSLFPESWVDYTGNSFPVKARVTQFSPLIPGDYRRVSYPVGVYEWSLTNPTASSYEVAIMLSWNNTFSGSSAALTQTGNQVGLVLTRAGGNATAENQGEFSLGSISSASVSVTRASNTTLANLEADFSTDGLLSDVVGANSLGGLAFKVTLAPGETIRVPIVLAWDIPIAQVGTSAANRWYRRYTRYFGRTGLNSWGIAAEALTDHASWETSLDAWQGGILGNPNYPNWLKSTLFNELYIYFAGGTYWEAGAAGGQADDPNEDMFSHLESYIYPFYGTSDVRFYGSWALFLNWPDIDKQAVKQFSDSVYHNRTDRPAPLGTTAHDFGDNNSCFTQWNAYTYRDSTQWKDLNSKLVLMVWRDYVLSGSSDTAFLNYCWRPVTTAMARVKGQDSDGDGLPNSSGIDQTYDDMDLTGDTAYCGGLFLAACQAAKQIALARGDTAQANTYQAWFDQGQPSFESELWTGSYYRIDTGSFDPTRIMSDQMCGQWYSKALGLGGIVPDARAQSALQTIHDNNFMRFDSGTHGIVNVMTSAGNIDTSTPQTQECWVGTSWGAVAGMVHQGLLTQAGNVGQSLYNTIWNTSQFWFRTPEAWRTGVTQTRAYYYMRATTVWAVKRAFDSSSFITPVPTPTRTGTQTATRTPTATPPAPTATSSRTSTSTVTATRTVTPTVSRTATPTSTPPVPTHTSSRTATSSATPTASNTRTSSATLTASLTPSRTSTQTPPMPTLTSSRTATPSATSTSTPPVPSPTGTPTRTSSATSTPTVILTFTATPTLPAPTGTHTGTRTSTATVTPTLTVPSTSTASLTATRTATLSATSTGTPLPPTPTWTVTSSRTPTSTTTRTLTETPSPSMSLTRTSTGTPSPTLSQSSTHSPTVSWTPTASRTPTWTASHTSSRTMTATFTSTPTFTFTFSPTFTPTPTLSPTPAVSATLSSTPTPLITATATLAAGRSPLVFPNPVHGPIARFLPQAYGTPSDVKAQVYTPTFKLVLTKNYPSVPPGTSLSLDLVDDWGEPLAGGLYYLVVTLQGKRGTTKLVVAP